MWVVTCSEPVATGMPPSSAVLPLRHQIVRETQLQYNAMRAGVFQLLQAKRDEIDAGREYVESLRDYWVARADLERAVGGRLPATVASTRPATPGPDATTQPVSGGEEHQHRHKQGE